MLLVARICRRSREKTDMLRSIGKQSGESVVSPGEEMVGYGGLDKISLNS